MSYERSLISDTPTSLPSVPAPQMREERVIEPFRSSSVRLTKAMETVASNQNGQNAQSSGETLAKVTEEQVTPAETVTLSPQMAALARKEQRFRQNELSLKAREADLATQLKEVADLKALKARLAAKDYSGVESQIPYDEYTQYLVEKMNQTSPEAQALKELAAKVDGVEAKIKDDVSKRFEAAVQERRRAVKDLVLNKPEFIAIKKAKAEEAVVQHILDTWEHDNIDLSPEDAAREVSKELLARASQWKSLLEEEQEQPNQGDEKRNLPPLKPAIKTLTNNMLATGEIKRPIKPLHLMTDQERYVEARRRAEEKLKQQGRF